ncbi:hypothetical protein OAT67_00850 [Bacteriovoracaceae bacterium]|nr:hypothetical protein [Bacteriovoracaceae bacterium]
MKLILCSILFTLSQFVSAMSCDTIENGKKTMCNSYTHFKKKDPVKLKKLCTAGDMDTPYMKIKGVLNKTECNPKGAIAKCRLRDHDMTIYFSGEMKVLEKGCKFFKKAEFIKL